MQVCFAHPGLASMMLKNPGDDVIPIIELLCHDQT